MPYIHIDRTNEFASYMITREVAKGLIRIKINNKFKKDKDFVGNRKYLTINESHLKVILTEKYGKCLKERKIF